ncbi:MAG: hypothetical protein R6W70_10940 [bacterium]
MKKTLLIISLTFLFVSLLSKSFEEIKPGVFTTGAYIDISSGVPGQGVALGGKSSETGGGDEFFCIYSESEDNWKDCPGGLHSNNPLEGGGSVISVAHAGGDKMIATRIEIHSFNIVVAIVEFSLSNPSDFKVLHIFPKEENANEESIEVVGDTIWVGTSDGRVLRSEDRGASWEGFPIPGPSEGSSVSEIKINVLRFYDENHGLATGGIIEKENIGEDEKEVLKEAGGVWETADGGQTWTPVVKNRLFSGVFIEKTSSGRYFLAAIKENGLNISDKQRALTLLSCDHPCEDFNEIEVVSEESNRELTTSEVGGLAVHNDTVWVGGMGKGFNQCIFVSHDSGETWEEIFVPDFGGMWKPSIIAMADGQNVYAGTTLTALLKYFDPDGDAPENNDDNETFDDDTLPEDDFQDEDNENDLSDNDHHEDTEKEDADTTSVSDEGCSCSTVF